MNKGSIIILHGWGLNGAKYSELSALLKKEGYLVYAPDFPGFGSEPLKKESMILDDYVEFLKDYINENKIENPILIGHSFGGRVALKYAWKHKDKISKVILSGAPIIRYVPFSKKIVGGVISASGKLLNFFPVCIKNPLRKVLYCSIGEWDYYKSGKLKETFKNIISEDLIQFMREVKTPVGLIWGEEDSITPVSIADKIKEINPKVKSIIIPNANHGVPYRNPQEFFNAFQKLI